MSDATYYERSALVVGIVGMIAYAAWWVVPAVQGYFAHLTAALGQ